MSVRTVQLGKHVQILGGGTPSRDRPEYFIGSIPWVTVKDLGDDFFIQGAQEHVSEAGLNDSASRLIPAGNVIVSTRMAVGRAVINRCDVAINQDLKALIVEDTLDPKYLLFFMAAAAPSLEAKATGATVKGITIDAIRALEIPLPDLPEQKRIAKILEEADRLRRTRRYALELSDTFLPAAFIQLFGDLEIENAPTVEELAAKKPNAIRTGPFGSQLLHSEFTDSGIAVLGIDNAVNNRFEWGDRRFISPEKYEQLKRYTVFPGDVIITIMGTCGRCAIVPDDIPPAINTKHLCCITLDQKRCLPHYLHGAFFFHPFVRQQLQRANKGAIMDGLNMGIIEGLRIPLPNIEQQRHFAGMVEQYECLRTKQRESLRQAEHLFQSLLHRAFAGELTAATSGKIASSRASTRKTFPAPNYFLQLIPALLRAVGGSLSLEQLNATVGLLFLPEQFLPLIESAAGTDARSHFEGFKQTCAAGIFHDAVQFLGRSGALTHTKSKGIVMLHVDEAHMPPIDPVIETDAQHLAKIINLVPTDLEGQSLAALQPERVLKSLLATSTM